MGSAAPYLIDRPTEPINRRIAIIVLKKAVAEALTNGGMGLDGQQLINQGGGRNSPSTNPFLSADEVDNAVGSGLDRQQVMDQRGNNNTRTPAASTSASSAPTSISFPVEQKPVLSPEEIDNAIDSQ